MGLGLLKRHPWNRGNWRHEPVPLLLSPHGKTGNAGGYIWSRCTEPCAHTTPGASSKAGKSLGQGASEAFEAAATARSRRGRCYSGNGCACLASEGCCQPRRWCVGGASPGAGWRHCSGYSSAATNAGSGSSTAAPACDRKHWGHGAQGSCWRRGGRCSNASASRGGRSTSTCNGQGRTAGSPSFRRHGSRMSLRLNPRVFLYVTRDGLARNQSWFRLGLKLGLQVLSGLEFFEVVVPRRAGKGSLHEVGTEPEEP